MAPGKTAKPRPRKKTGRHQALRGFLPCVARWFERTFERPSPAQELAWPAIRRGENVLLLAPTGSGKTLAAFLCAIDDLRRRAEAGELADGVHVLYISPLKALGNDIHKNLLVPLAGIKKLGKKGVPEIRIAVRTGDTTQADRQRMIRTPPHVLITTPESFYLLLGSKRMAPNLRTIRTVIVDEVHAVCDNKRGVHLAVSLERLQERLDGRLQRVGCSATLSPLDEIAAFVVGRDGGGQQRPCTILNAGQRKDLDVQVAAPLPDFLEATHQALWASAHERLLDEIEAHDTTLIFCNSRYKAERTSLRLAELAGDRVRIGAHHGSMSKELRLEAEDDLKAGRLDALVATASLELGIDVGSIDLVYQLESAKSVATGLQRIGRAGHLLDATSKGRVLIFARDELLEGAAMTRAMLDGRMDAIRIPCGCLDVLAQQVVGAVATRDWQADELLAVIRRAYPYADLTEQDYETVLTMAAGDHPFEMANAPRPLILWDRPTGRLHAARGAKQIAAMCVGTIPETSEYDVVIDGIKKRVGKVQSEFVDDCLRTGDVFVLGSTAWKVTGYDRNRLLVQEAPGATPTVPWWTGPIEPRTAELGTWIGELRREIADRLDKPDVAGWLERTYRLDVNAAAALTTYIREQRLAAGLVPDHEQLLVEVWRDELGRSNIIIHSPFGERINRAWGVSLSTASRQRWSVAVSNDVVLLSQAAARPKPLTVAGARDLLAAVTAGAVRPLAAKAARTGGVLASSFRDAAVTAFQVLRAWQGRRVPVWLQNFRAGELLLAAARCEGYPVVREVLRGYLEESLDVPGLEALLGRIEAGKVTLTVQQVESPSPFAHALLIQDQYRGGHQMGRERRAHLLRLHRRVLQEVLSEEQMAELLDARAIEELERRQLHGSETTHARSTDELAKAIRDLGDPPATIEAVGRITDGDAAEMLKPLVADRRVVAFEVPECETDPVRLVAADLWREYHDAYGLARPGQKLTVLLPQIKRGEIVGFEPTAAADVIPARWRRRVDQDRARAAIVERHLRRRGPVTLYELVNHTGWPAGAVEAILQGLVDAGRAARGVYTSNKPRPQWVNKANLEEIHRLTMRYLKRELAACAPYEVVDFMTRWQHVHSSTRLSGLDGLRRAIEQFQGIEVVTGALESEVLAARVADYRPEMLERLIGSGEVSWRRVGTDRVRRGKVTLCLRKDAEWLARGAPMEFDVEEEADADIPDAIKAVRAYFRRHATAFFDDVGSATGLDEGHILRAVWYLAWCGEVTCDTYECLRHSDFQVTVSACYDLYSRPERILRGWGSSSWPVDHLRRRGLDPRLGRWSATERLVPPKKPMPENEVLRRWADLLLRRWGIVTRDVLAAEAAAPRWGTLLPEFKRLELLGLVQRGYFIDGHHGEQYGLPEAIEMLRDCRARRGGEALGYLPDEPVFTISNRDPANLYGSCLPILDERGQRYPHSLKRGSVILRFVLQAGQGLLWSNPGWRNIDQLVALDRRQLERCVEAFRRDPADGEVATELRRWNGCPVEVSPAGAVLWGMGFRFKDEQTLAWPPTGNSGRRPLAQPPDLFPPYFEPQTDVTFGREWTLDHASKEARPVLQKVLDVAVRGLDREGWELTWRHSGPTARYRGEGWFGVLLGRRNVCVRFGTPLVRQGKKRERFRETFCVRRPREVDDEFVARFRRCVEQVEAFIERYVEARNASR